MGKGRQIAAMFKEHFRKNRDRGCTKIRGLWISVLPLPLPCFLVLPVKSSVGLLLSALPLSTVHVPLSGGKCVRPPVHFAQYISLLLNVAQ